MDFLWFVLVGAAAGWLAGQIFKGSGLDLLGDIIVGILGGVIGGWLAGRLGISFGDGVLGTLLPSTGVAIILLYIASLIKKA